MTTKRVFLLMLFPLMLLSCRQKTKGNPGYNPSPVKMIQVPVPSGNITFPMGTMDNQAGTVDLPFLLGETEVTNELVAGILQWAYDKGRLSDNKNDTDSVTPKSVVYGKQILINLTAPDCRISYSEARFTVESGYEKHPAVWVSWYGAVILCNWLTEREESTPV